MNENKHLVSPQWLYQQLNNPQLVVVDCRFQLKEPKWGYQQYLKAHIPGSYYLDLDRDLSSTVEKHGGRHPLPRAELLAQKLAASGIIKDETLVVAYDDSRFAFAARLWWLLRYLGHDRVALLDGGWNAYRSAGYPISDVVPSSGQGTFIPQPRRDSIVDIETVKARKDRSSVVLVDSRDEERYRGETEPIDPIAGHIEGAVNSPWKQVTDEGGYFLRESAQQLSDRYSHASEIIVYCGSGVTACVNLFSLDVVGIGNAKLYAGGWSDWCSYLV